MKKLSLRIAILYALAGGCWMAFSEWVVAPAVSDAYARKGPPFLNRLLAGRTRHPLGHYLGLWRDLEDAVLLGLGCHLVVVAVAASRFRGWDDDGEGRRFFRSVAVASAAFLGAAVASGPRQDYSAYLEEWAMVWRGDDPWQVDPRRGFPLNAYGPLFNAFAPMARAIPLAPKLVGVLAYCLFVVVFLGRVGPREAGRALAFFLGPFFWVEVAYYGHTDVLVAIACVAAVDARVRGRDAASGVCLGLGFLLKYLPAVLLPFLAVDCRRLRPRLAMSALAVMAIGMAAGLAFWGSSLFRPLTFAATRGPTLLSIHHFLVNRFSPFRSFVDFSFVDRLGTPILAVALLATWLACWRRRADAATSALAGALTVLLFYRVGFVQYQMTVFLLASYWACRHRRSPSRGPTLVAGGVYLGWISLFDLVYAYAGGILKPGDPLFWLDEVAGLPTFVFGFALLASLLRQMRPDAPVRAPATET